MLLSGCSLDAFFEEAIFSCRFLLLSTSVLNDNTKGINRCKIIVHPCTQLITMLEVAITVVWVSYTCMMVASYQMSAYSCTIYRPLRY